MLYIIQSFGEGGYARAAFLTRKWFFGLPIIYPSIFLAIQSYGYLVIKSFIPDAFVCSTCGVTLSVFSYFVLPALSKIFCGLPLSPISSGHLLLHFPVSRSNLNLTSLFGGYDLSPIFLCSSENISHITDLSFFRLSTTFRVLSKLHFHE